MQLPDALSHWLLVAASAAAIGFFAAGLTLYFERAPRPPWVLFVHYLSLTLALASFLGVLLLPARSDTWVGVAIAMYTAAIAIFLSAIESAKRTRLQRSFVDYPLPDRLITGGPYKMGPSPVLFGLPVRRAGGPDRHRSPRDVPGRGAAGGDFGAGRGPRGADLAVGAARGRVSRVSAAHRDVHPVHRPRLVLAARRGGPGIELFDGRG